MISLRLVVTALVALIALVAGCSGSKGKGAPAPVGAKVGAPKPAPAVRDSRRLDEVSQLLADLDSGDEDRAAALVLMGRAEEALGAIGPSVAPRTRTAFAAVHPEARAAACRLAFKFRDEAAIPGMINLLGDDSRLVRSTANVFLCGLTDQDFGFRPDATPEDRAAARAAWAAWYAKTYGPVLAPKRK